MSALGAKVTDESKLWSITEHSLLQVSGVFFLRLTSSMKAALPGEMPRATDKSSAPCTQVVAEPELETETELRLKPLKPQTDTKKKETEKRLSNRLGCI